MNHTVLKQNTSQKKNKQQTCIPLILKLCITANKALKKREK